MWTNMSRYMNSEEGTWPTVRLTEREDVSAVLETLQMGLTYCCV